MATIRLAKPNPDRTVSEEAVGPYWSLMLEVSSGPLRTIDDKTIGESDCIVCNGSIES